MLWSVTNGSFGSNPHVLAACLAALVLMIPQVLHAGGFRAMVHVDLIQTYGVTVPSDLQDPKDQNKLRPGLNFDSLQLIQRYLMVLSKAAPLVTKYNGFFLGFGQEVGQFLIQNPIYQDPFVRLIALSAEFSRNVSSPQLATGVSLTHRTLIDDRSHPVIEHLLQACDVTPLTYKAWDSKSDFMVEDPSAPAKDLPAMVLALPQGVPLVLAQVGYASGYLPPRQAGDNSTIFKQYAFYHTLFSILAGSGEQGIAGVLRNGQGHGSAMAKQMSRGAAAVTVPEGHGHGRGKEAKAGRGAGPSILRVLVVDMLVDVPRSTCEQLSRQYTIPPVYLEDLCSTGLFAEDGAQKPAMDSVIHGFLSLSAAAEAASGSSQPRADARRLAAAL